MDIPTTENESAATITSTSESTDSAVIEVTTEAVNTAGFVISASSNSLDSSASDAVVFSDASNSPNTSASTEVPAPEAIVVSAPLVPPTPPLSTPKRPSASPVASAAATVPISSATAAAPAASATSATSEESVNEPHLSDYLNYRDFLRSFYLYKREMTKSHHRRYNYSFFSAAADIRSPNYLRLIIEGQRNLSEEMAFKFARAMQLNKESTDEFVLMVLYSQETDPMLRNQYLKTLSDFRLQKSLRLGVIDKKVLEKVPNWIGWILFALLDQEGARFTSSTLKHLLRNKASETEIQNALNKLLESGELVLDAETGAIKKGRSQGDAGDDIPSDLIRRLQTQLMSLGLESLFQDSPLDREFGTLTLSLTKKEFEDLRFQLRKFRKQIHKDNSIQRMQSKGERVYQLNLQLYPVTDRSQTIAELENN